MTLYSIETLDPANIMDTMNKPVIVHASDLEYYFCKYNRMNSRAYRLFKEFLIAAFLQHWQFLTAPVNFINVQDEHIPLDLGIRRSFFSMPCFGLRLVENANELDKHNTALLLKRRIHPLFREDFLRLSFFDIWTANEDRSHNNYNILLVRKEGVYYFLPIDHEACFNHGEFNHPLVPITYEESLIYSEAFSFIFKPGDFTAFGLAALKHKYYLCVQACMQNLPAILASVPVEWGINIIAEGEILARFLFNDSWFNQAWTAFLEHIQLFKIRQV